MEDRKRGWAEQLHSYQLLDMELDLSLPPLDYTIQIWQRSLLML